MNIEFEIKDIKHDLNYAKKCEYEHVTLDVYKVQTLLTAYEKEKEKNKKAIDFINDKNNYFEDGENWQNILKIKDILEE